MLALLINTSIVQTKANDILVDAGYKYAWAQAALRWLGIGFTTVSVAQALSELKNKLDIIPFEQALEDKKGVLRAEYYTAYQGAWYIQSLTEKWNSYPTVYEPKTVYGQGVYKSY